MYLIIILTIEINNDNNKNDIVWLILSFVLLFPIGSDVQIDMNKRSHNLFKTCNMPLIELALLRVPIIKCHLPSNN